MTGTTEQFDKLWFTRRKALQAHLDELIMECEPRRQGRGARVWAFRNPDANGPKYAGKASLRPPGTAGGHGGASPHPCRLVGPARSAPLLVLKS